MQSGADSGLKLGTSSRPNVSGKKWVAVMIAGLCLSVLTTSIDSAYSPQVSSSSVVIQKLASQFKLTDKERNLFEFGKEHVLQPAFDNRGGLVAIRVVPKHVFEDSHPDWTEPDSPPTMSVAEFDRLIAKIEAIQSIGAFVSKQDSAVTNGAFTPRRYNYKKAAIRALVYRYSALQEYSINSFTIWFMREVTGTVTSKSSPALFDPYSPIFSIDGSPYVTVSQEIFDKAQIGRRNTFSVGGPMDIVFEK